jgi:hypothetical protein
LAFTGNGPYAPLVVAVGFVLLTVGALARRLAHRRGKAPK